MSISGQQAINIGLPNESINSDTLYTAFTKTQENFTQLFTCASPFTNFVASTGIGITSNATTGTVTFTNTGVTQIVAGTNVVVANVGGVVTISATGGGGGGGGTVTSVGLSPVSTSRLLVTNSPIISSGIMTIDLAATGVAQGTYTNPTVTVDEYGRVTTISSGPTLGTVTSVGLTAGPGLQVNGGPITSTGNIVVTNTGVLKLTAGSGIDLSGSTGNITVSLAAGGVGTVTSVGIISTSLEVTNSPITTNGTIRVELPASPTITGNLSVANANLGNTATANYFVGSGNNLSNIQGANVTGTVPSSTVSGTVTVAAQPNITSTGTLISLNVSGNANVGNIGATNFVGSGQYLTGITGANVTGVVGNASNATRVATTLQTTGTYYLPFITATTTANYGLNSNTLFTANVANGAMLATTFVGNLSTTGNSNIGNLGFGTGVITGTGNITGGNIIGIIAAGSNTITTIGNITGGNIIGIIAAGSNTITTTGNASVGNLGFGTGVITGTGNITAGNIIGIIAAGSNTITTTGNVSGGNIIATSYHIRSIATAISAAGSTQGTATALTKEINVVSTVSSGQGVILPSAVAGMVLIINNTSANTLNVYPGTSAAINNGSLNSAYSHVSGASLQYYATSATQWYTVGASYA